MGLTPIHVRGKRSRNKRKGNDTSEESASDSLVSKRSKQGRSLHTILAERASRRSTLENLPIEVLELIFLHCSSPFPCSGTRTAEYPLALPMASPILGMRLSGKTTLLRLTGWVFHESWNSACEAYNGNGEYQTPPTTKEKASEADKQLHWLDTPDLETAVLARSWATLEFMEQAMRVWVDKYAKGRSFDFFPKVCATQGIREPLEQAFRRKDEPDCPNDPNHTPERKAFEASFILVKYRCREVADIFPTSYPLIHPGTSIPTHLLTGPWTEESERMLYWFFLAGAAISTEERPLPWELTKEILFKAVLDTEQTNWFMTNLILRNYYMRSVYYDLPLEERRQWKIITQQKFQYARESHNSKLLQLMNMLQTIVCTTRPEDDAPLGSGFEVIRQFIDASPPRIMAPTN